MMDRDLRDLKQRDAEGVTSIAPLLIAAALGAGATLFGASKSASATKDASDAAAQSARENNQLQREIYAQNTANLDPFMQRGNAAGDTYNALLGLGGDPAAAKSAFEQYQGSTGYQAQMQSGVDAISQNAITGGAGLRSGAALKALTRFGNGLGAQSFQGYLNNLGTQQGVGLSGANALAGVGSNYAGAVSQNNDSAAAAQGNAALSGAANTNALLGSLGSAFGTYAGLSSYKPAAVAATPAPFDPNAFFGYN